MEEVLPIDQPSVTEIRRKVTGKIAYKGCFSVTMIFNLRLHQANPLPRTIHESVL